MDWLLVGEESDDIKDYSQSSTSNDATYDNVDVDELHANVHDPLPYLSSAYFSFDREVYNLMIMVL